MDDRKEPHRLEARARRKAIPAEAKRAKDAAIRARVLALPEVDAAIVVATYVSVHSEVDTRALIADLLGAGKRVAVPVQTPGSMRLAELAAPDALALGAHGIPEPAPPRVLLDDANVVLVPGLVFTTDGHRLGQGGGHYDRLLAAMPRAQRVGLAYEEQLARRLPIETHDEPMDVVVTDLRVLRRARGRE